jgi:hypothetical protein
MRRGTCLHVTRSDGGVRCRRPLSPHAESPVSSSPSVVEWPSPSGGTSLCALGAQNENTGAYVLAFTAVWILLAGVGAWLMRTWWALLTIPVAFFVGYMLGAVIDGLMPGNALSSAELALGAAIFGIFYLLPLVLVYLLPLVLVYLLPLVLVYLLPLVLVYLLPLVLVALIGTAISKRTAR